MPSINIKPSELNVKGFFGLLGSLKTMKVNKWASDSDQLFTKDHGEHIDDREDAEIFGGANVVTSQRADYTFRKRHAILLDIDKPAYLIPSTSYGHSHLYVDVDANEEDYFNFLDAAAKVGLIETGYAKASRAKGATFLRLPWIRKGEK